MNIITCELPGLLVIEPKVFGDQRGFFMETWHQKRYAECGLPENFVQDNLSFSRRGILRGLHFQNPNPQAKLVSVLEGEVFDVALDIRRGSPTFGRTHAVVLSSQNKRQFFLPAGFAHGFLVTSETALFHYKCTEYYSPQHEGAIRWNDPDLGIQWPVQAPLLSTKDASAPLLKEMPLERLFP
jgi:dTDP-4-dehydrorhamnose 3,5-epimerase